MNYLIPVVVVALIGLIAGIILTIFSKLMAVSVDERVALIREVLPGANCGACGFAGCDDYAAALGSDSDVAPNLCPPGGTSVAAQIAEILGVDAGSTEAKYAEVLCKGSCEHTKPLMEYQGIKTCKAVKNFFGGHGSCRYGCLGFGDCVTACPYDAIHVVDGVAIVDRNNCVGCGLCVKACPNDIIQIAPGKNLIYVGCSNQDKGGVARKTCGVACIGCMKCVKACRFDSIKVENNLAYINPETCRNCTMCVKECPTGAIMQLPRPKKPAAKTQTSKPQPSQPENQQVANA